MCYVHAENTCALDVYYTYIYCACAPIAQRPTTLTLYAIGLNTRTYFTCVRVTPVVLYIYISRARATLFVCTYTHPMYIQFRKTRAIQTNRAASWCRRERQAHRACQPHITITHDARAIVSRVHAPCSRRRLPRPRAS